MAYMHDAPFTESPGRYGAHISVMREMRWSWQELSDAPNDLVEEILAHMSYRQQWERKRAELDKHRSNYGK